jgi:hypothetical protein
VGLVFGREKEDDAPPPARLHERSPDLGVRFELVVVAPHELVPALRIVAEPASKPLAGRDVLEPSVEGEVILPDPAGPEAIDEKATAGPGPGARSVHALRFDAHGMLWCIARASGRRLITAGGPTH